MVVLVGDSASGKSTIEKELIKMGMSKIISYTTRKIRDNETDGVDYHFISEEDFIDKKSKGFFAENTYHYKWFYGISISDCQSDKVVVVSPSGLRQLKNHGDLDIVSYYIKVSERNRFIKILQRGDDIHEAYRRIVCDSGMFNSVEAEVDFVIDNENYEMSPTDIVKIIMNNKEMTYE